MASEGSDRDSMLASRLLTNGMPQVKHGLAHVAKRILGLMSTRNNSVPTGAVISAKSSWITQRKM